MVLIHKGDRQVAISILFAAEVLMDHSRH